MGLTTHSIDVNAPLRAVYIHWTQFEEFPRLMEGVINVRQEWTANIGRKQKSWIAEITEQIPDISIVWKSIEGTPNSGMVMFEPVEANHTRVTLTIDDEPESFLETTGVAPGIPSSQVKEDLERFRNFTEARAAECNGEIHDGMTMDRTRVVETAPESVTESKQSKAVRGIQGDRPEVPCDIEKPDCAVPGVEAREERIDEGLAAEVQGFYRETVRVSPPSHSEIAARAYELYLRREKAPGHAEEDWLEAERQFFEESQHAEVH